MKRSNEQLRSQLSASLLQLEEARLAMERCDIDALIVNTYRDAAKGLKAARIGGGLSAETVEEAVDMMQEEVRVRCFIELNSNVTIIIAYVYY